MKNRINPPKEIPREAFSVGSRFLTEKLNPGGELENKEPITWIDPRGDEVSVYYLSKDEPGYYSRVVYDQFMNKQGKDKGKYQAPLVGDGAFEYRVDRITCSTLIRRDESELRAELDKIKPFIRHHDAV